VEEVLSIKRAYSLSSLVSREEMLKNYCTVLQMAVDASSAILHLHEQSILHRDIAGRNFLVDAFHRVCVADFGMSVLMHGAVFRGPKDERIPIAWAAPEVLRDHEHSKSSDVYSFGIFLWELIAQLPPYQGVTRAVLAHGVITEHLRPEIPGYCHQGLADLMKLCWQSGASERPTMREVNRRLEATREQFNNSAEEVYVAFDPRRMEPLGPAINQSTSSLTATTSSLNLGGKGSSSTSSRTTTTSTTTSSSSDGHTDSSGMGGDRYDVYDNHSVYGKLLK